MAIRVSSLFMCLTFGLSTNASGQSYIDTATLTHQIDSIAQVALEAKAFPGMQVLVRLKDETVFHKAYGFHTYDSLISVKTDDVYDLASITKVASVTTALMKLVGEGRFDLEATVADYFPEFENSDKADLIWRDILAHNARLQPWIPYWENTIKKNGKFKAHTFKDKWSKRYSIEITNNLYLCNNYKKKIYKAIKKTPLNDKPGYVYSGLAFYILPEIIERITGQSFEDYLKINIYIPIGANTITYNPLRYFPLDRIIPTERDTFFRMSQIHGKVHDEGAVMMGGVSGNAGLFATPADLGKLAQLYLNRGTFYRDTIIQPWAIDEFTRCQYCEEGNRRGLGFDKPPWPADPEASSVTICKDASPESFGHSGYTGTLMWVDPARDLVYLFFSNRVHPTRLNTRINTMLIRPAIHQAIYNSIN